MDGDSGTALDAAQRVLSSVGSIAVLTGAGISTDAGIPDFRGPDGLWTKNPGAERAANIETFLTDPEARRASWRMRLDSRLVQAEPTAGHDALVDLERRGALAGLVTQNIDGLHQKAGTSADLLTEVHGSIAGYACTVCGAGGPIEGVLDRVRAGDEDPSCAHCGGILKTTVVMFGEMLPEGAMERAMEVVDGADAFLAVGTTLEVSPVNSMAIRARQRGIPVVVVNRGETMADSFAEVKVDGSISEALPLILDVP
ncbi:MAG: SIR2 family NAD-dependent protein deacylase [Microthrixaceae bacterium]